MGERYVDIILIDIFKSYDCLPHDLLIAKLEAYGLDIGSLNTLLDYLSLKERRTKVGLIHCQKYRPSYFESHCSVKKTFEHCFNRFEIY